MKTKQPGVRPTPKNRPWTPEEHDRLAIACRMKPIPWKRIATELGRTVAACRQRASMGGLQKGASLFFKPCLKTGIRSRNAVAKCDCANCEEKRIVRRVKGRFACPNCSMMLALYGSGDDIVAFPADDLPKIGYRRVP